MARMTGLSFAQLEEARRALDAPLFADLAGDASVSFEFFPPKTEKMEEQLWHAIETLAPLGPRLARPGRFHAHGCTSGP